MSPPATLNTAAEVIIPPEKAYAQPCARGDSFFVNANGIAPNPHARSVNSAIQNTCQMTEFNDVSRAHRPCHAHRPHESLKIP